jgi:hypothetical protein
MSGVSAAAAVLGFVGLAWGARDMIRVLDLPVSIGQTLRELAAELGAAGFALALATPIAIAAISAIGTAAGAVALGRVVTTRRAARGRQRSTAVPNPVVAASGRP